MHRSGCDSQSASSYEREIDEMPASPATLPRMIDGQKSAGPVLLLGLLPALLAFAWLVSKAQWYWSHRPDMQFGWILLLLCAFVIWDRWANRPEPVWRIRWPFVVLGVAGLGMLFVMQLYQAAFGLMPAVMMGLTVGVYAIVGANLHYVYGWTGWRFYAFPLLFFLIALPMPSFLEGPLINGLQAKVATVNVE